VIARVAFPALSKVQDDLERLREGYFRSIHLTTIVAFPMSAGIIAVAPQFVPAVLGNDWAAMVPLMQVLALWGAQRALGANFGPLFKAIGRPDISTKIQALKVAIVAVLIYPAAEQFGVLGVAYVIVGNTLIVQPVAFYIALSVIDETFTRVLLLVVYPLFGSVLMWLTVVSVDRYVLGGTGIIELVVLILTGVVSYAAVMLLIDTTSSYEVTGLYRELKRHI
jgi:O-antigen/teichoic acid export membrane protein